MRNVALKALLPLLLTACGPSWVIVKQANPNPLLGKKAFATEAINWDKTMIGASDSDRKSIDAYISGKKAEEQAGEKASLMTDFQASSDMFKGMILLKGKDKGLDMAAAAGADVFGIKIEATVYEPGFWSPLGFGNRNTEVWATVQITDGAGAVVDEVKFKASIPTKVIFGVPTNPKRNDRIKEAGQNLAEQLAQYLAGRTAGK